MTKPDEQAFPRNYATGLMNQFGQHELKSFPGMTKRERFAMAAMQGMHAGGRIFTDKVATLAVKEADDLIAALNEVVLEPAPVILPPTDITSLGDDIPF